MKYRIETQKPNTYQKKLRSEILDTDLKIWISMKTRKCIMKAGSLDRYLLTTGPSKLDSKFGLYLKNLIQEKQRDPSNFTLPYIPGSATQRKTRKTKVWQYKQIPAMYTPAHIRQKVDLSEFYEKIPAEMSRYELQELETAIRLMEE